MIAHNKLLKVLEVRIQRNDRTDKPAGLPPAGSHSSRFNFRLTA
jgi:hypothetical protein